MTHEVNTANPLGAPYRTGSYLISDEGPDNFRTGMALTDHPYRASGSHQLGISDFVTVLGEGVINPYQPETLCLVDLREETHGFFNGTPVSWYSDNDFGNVGMSAGLIIAEEEARLGVYEGEKTQLFTIEDDATDDLKQERVLPVSYVETVVSSARTEAEVAELLSDVFKPTKVTYVRIPVTDHCAPGEKALTRLENLASASWVHFHCHGGDGRTTTFLALYDMLSWFRENRRGSVGTPLPSVEEFAARQCQLFSYCLNPDGCTNCGEATTGWKLSLAQQRWNAINDFHRRLS